MVANLPPQYWAAENKLKTAKTPQEKIAILEEMLAIVPKHKGTEKLQAQLKAKIAKLKREKKKKGVTTFQRVPVILKEGAGQIIIAGPVNSGKSTLLAKLTNAQPEISEFPFTTKIPQPGMMSYEDIMIQLVDTPALAKGFTPNWLGDILRKSDGLLLVFDPSQDNILDTFEEIREILENFRVSDKKTLFLANKIDLPRARENLAILKDYLGNKIQIKEISALKNINLEELKKEIFNLLEIVRVYSKKPGRPPDLKNPFVLKKGSNLSDLLKEIHQNLFSNFKYAKLWKKSSTTNPLIVGKTQILEDGDIIEIHT